MSLVKTLAKVAIGVAVAKGAQAMMKGGGTGGIAGMLKGNGGGGALGEMMSSLTQGMQGGGGAAGGMAGMQKGLSDMMGQMTSGGQAAAGGLGDMMQKMASGQSVGGLQNVLSQMGSGGGLGALLGGAGAAGGAGGLGALLGGAGAAGGAGGLGALLGGALLSDPTPPEPSDEAIALIMLRAMLQAAKCDGRLDEAEQAQIEQMVGGMSDEESALIKQELSAPVDVRGLAAEVPKGLEEQAYMMSLIAIDLDSQAEADYLISFAGALGLSPAQVDALHTQAGEPKIT